MRSFQALQLPTETSPYTLNHTEKGFTLRVPACSVKYSSDESNQRELTPVNVLLIRDGSTWQLSGVN